MAVISKLTGPASAGATVGERLATIGFAFRDGLMLFGKEDHGKAWKWLYPWLAIALLLRATIALGGNFVLHPDEIMQYLEPAHRAVFGNGIVFWEFVYGGRSWLVPGLVAMVLWALDILGLGVPWIYVYVVKMVFCTLSLLVPWGTYHFARKLLGESSARLSLVLTCLWPYLVVFAHKPFTEFVATSLLFGALGLACSSAGFSRKKAFTIGALLTLVAAVRMQYLPLAALALIAGLIGRPKTVVMAKLCGCATALLLVGLLETMTWGVPFHSYYINYVYNDELDNARDAQPWFFYLHRLLFVSAGCALVALYAFATQMRRHLLVFSLVLATLALHMLQPHKELRFVFVLIPLLLLVASDQLALWSLKWPAALSHKKVGLAAGTFLALIGTNAIDDRWLHEAASRERGDVRYLFGQHNLFGIYLELAKLNDVKGVLNYSDLYYNSPGYYYLHHDVPFYDIQIYEKVLEEEGDRESVQYYSHLVIFDVFPDLQGYVEIQSEGEPYRYGFISGQAEVRPWKNQSIMLLSHEAVHVARTRLGLPDEVKPPLFEFAD